ncbi:MAG: hypothetical protein JO170_00605 [Verrucomicrobia bacterium]|nr:hypothetical protein [Verrucomicrobiota bacterium]
MKWRNITAQGFSHGSGPNKTALKGASDRTGRQLFTNVHFKVWMGDVRNLRRKPAEYSAATCRADSFIGLTPGLKPWAVPFRHFMAIYLSLMATLHRSNTPPLRFSITPDAVPPQCGLEISIEPSHVADLPLQQRGDPGECRP